jgi:hypothetical protein
MRRHFYIVVSGLALLVAGCGKDPVVKEIQEIRAEGQLQEARDKTIAALQDSPANMDLWLEFAGVAVDQTRASERENGPHTLNYLVEASLVCGTVYKAKHQNPNREWRDACRLCASEVTKQANTIQTTLAAQASSAQYFKQVLELQRGDVGRRDAEISAAQMVEDYRSNARTLLYQAVVVRRLIELLPEVSPGAATMLITQIETARDDWMRNLELAPDLTGPVQDRANHAVDKAFDLAAGDLQTVGYFILGTILDNGILE